MADENLQVTLTATDAGASAVMQQALAIVRQLDGTVVKLGESGQKSGESVAQGFKKVGESADSTVGGLKTFADHTRLATMGLDAMGLESAATAARVGGLLDVLNDAKAALPDLIALAAAFTGIAVSANFLKDAVTAAGEFDRTLVELGQTVANQGGNWEALKASTLAWADAQEKATQFSRGQALGAVKELTAAGTDLHDSLIIVGVAEDAAAATGQSLTDVVHGLMEAEHGRTQILASLGIATRAQIKDGMSLQQVLDQIEQNMGGVAQAAVNTLPGALAQLHNSFETFEEDAGEKFQGVMVQIVQDLTAVVDEMDGEFMPQLQKFADWAQSELPTAEQDVRDLWQAFQDGYTDVKNVIGFLIDHKDEVEAFFDVVIAAKAVGAVRALIGALIDLRATMIASDMWSAASLLVEAFTAKLGEQGLLGAIKALITGLYDLGAAEAVATLGLSAIVAALIYGETHWQQTVNIISDMVDTLAALVEKYGEVAEWAGKVLEATPGFYDQGKALEAVGVGAEHAAQGMRDYAQAKRDAASATGPVTPTDTSQQMAEDERYIASGGKMDVSPRLAGMSVHDAQQDLQGLLMEMHGAPQGAPAAKKPPGTLDNNPKVGGTTGGGSASPPAQVEDAFANESRATVNGADAQVKALDPLVQLKARLTSQEEALTRAMNMSTTHQQYDAAALQLRNKQIADALTYEKALNDAVAHETDQQRTAVAAVNATHDAYEKARTKYNEYEQSLDGVSKKTEAQKEHEKQLKDAVTQTQKAHEQAKTALDHINTALSQHITQLEAARQKYQDLKDKADEVVPALERKWNDFLDKQKQSMAEDLATFDMSNEQKVVYYAQMVNSIRAIDDQSLQLKEQAYQKEAQAFAQMLKDEQTAVKQFDKDYQSQQETIASYGLSTDQLMTYWQRKLDIDQQMNQRFFDQHGYWDAQMISQEGSAYKSLLDEQTKAYEQSYQEREQLESTFLDDILTKHQSFKTALTSVWSDITKMYVTNLQQMIEQSSAFQNIFGALVPGGVHAPNATPPSQLTQMFGNIGNTPATQLTTASTQLTTSATNLTTSATNITNSAQQVVQQFATPIQGLSTAGTGLQQAAQALLQTANALGGNGGLGSILQPSNFVNGIPEFASGDVFTAPSGQLGTPVFANGQYTGGTYGPNGIELSPDSITALTGSATGVSPSSAQADANTKPAQSLFAGGGTLSSALMGLAIGSSEGGGNIYSDILGAAGGYFGGPLGAMAGGFLGSFIGPHWGPPSNYPDRSNTAVYGPDVAALFGAGYNGENAEHANGQSFNMDPALAAQTGGLGLLQFISQFESQNPQEAQELLGPLYQMFQGLDVKTPITGGKNGNFTLANGQTINWQTLFNDAMTAMGDIGPQGAAPVFSLSRTYPNLNVSSLVGPYGTYAENNAGGTYTPSAPGGGSNVTPIETQPRTIEAHFNGNMTFFGGGSKAEFVQWITQQLANVDLGAQPTGIPARTGLRKTF